MARVIGLIEMQAKLAAVRGSLPHKIDAALTVEAEAIMTEAKRQSPVDTGAMRASGYVAPPETSGNLHRIELGFGGAAKDYVIYVHENLTAHHPTGNAKFLEQPLRAAAPSLLGNIATRIAFDK